MLGQQLQAIVDIPPDSMRSIIIGAYVLVGASMATIVAQIGQGKRWARFSLVISLAFELMSLAEPPDGGLVGYLADVPDFGLQLVALYWLYTTPGREWFARAPRG